MKLACGSLSCFVPNTQAALQLCIFLFASLPDYNTVSWQPQGRGVTRHISHLQW